VERTATKTYRAVPPGSVCLGGRISRNVVYLHVLWATTWRLHVIRVQLRIVRKVFTLAKLDGDNQAAIDIELGE
jgi:hypothetical protein